MRAVDNQKHIIGVIIAKNILVNCCFFQPLLCSCHTACTLTLSKLIVCYVATPDTRTIPSHILQKPIPSQVPRVYTQTPWLKSLVAHHLNLPFPDTCEVSEPTEWRHGSFNVCVPVTLHNWKEKKQDRERKRVMVRFPLPYRVGEALRAGNADEKVRCEAGTYAWLGGKESISHPT